MGGYYTVVAFLPLLDAANKRQPSPTSGMVPPPRAQVIVTSSAAAWIRAVYPSLLYIVSKAALTQMVKSLLTKFAPHGIRVNGIAPGVYATENISNIYGSYEQITSYESISRDLIPLTRTGGVEDLVGLILYMASLAGGNLNGSIMVSDGGSLSVVQSNY